MYNGKQICLPKIYMHDSCTSILKLCMNVLNSFEYQCTKKVLNVSTTIFYNTIQSTLAIYMYEHDYQPQSLHACTDIPCL